MKISINIFNKGVDHKSHLRVRVGLTQLKTFPEFPNIATYMQGNLCFCRKALSGPSNTSQAVSESCAEKFNWGSISSCTKKSSFYSYTSEAFERISFKEVTYLKNGLYTRASYGIEKENEGKKNQISEYLTKEKIRVRLQMGYTKQRLRADFLHYTPIPPPFCVQDVFCWEDIENMEGQEW